MILRKCIALCWFGVLLVGVKAQTDAASLRLSFAIPSVAGGDKYISIDRNPYVSLLLTNTSSRPQRVWKEWTSWGYNNLRLIVQYPDKSVAIVRKVQHIDSDFPDFWEISPGESLVFTIDLSKGEWAGFPDPYGEQVPVILEAYYEIPVHYLTDEFGIWTGKITAKPTDVIFK